MYFQGRVDQTWMAIGRLKDGVSNKEMFSALAFFMLGVLTVPHSNAGCERIFSQVRKNRMDQRSSLGAYTLESLLVLKGQGEFLPEKRYSDKKLLNLKSCYYDSLQNRKL